MFSLLDNAQRMLNFAEDSSQITSRRSHRGSIKISSYQRKHGVY